MSLQLLGGGCKLGGSDSPMVRNATFVAAQTTRLANAQIASSTQTPVPSTKTGIGDMGDRVGLIGKPRQALQAVTSTRRLVSPLPPQYTL